MKRKSNTMALIVSSFIFLGGSALAQTTVEWSKTYGGNGADRGHCIKQTSDGGYIISGYTDSDNNGDVTGYKGGGDVWVVKTDNAGNLEWQSAYGGYGGEPWTVAYTTVLQTTDGGYLVTAESFSDDGDLTENKGNLDLWVFKIDNVGDLDWQKSLGGANHEGAFSVLQEPDGGFLLAGYTSSIDGDIGSMYGMNDGWLVKLDNAGNLLWEKNFGGTWTDALTSIIPTDDGGYIAAGYTLSDDNDLDGVNPGGFWEKANYWIVKLDENADIEWQTALGGNGEDIATAIIQSPDGGYVVAGKTDEAGGDVGVAFGKSDWWIVKLDGAGTLEWEKSLGGAKKDEVRYMQAYSDGSGFFIVGTTESTDGHVTTNHGEKDIWFVKMDFDGNIITNQCYGGTENEEGFYGIESLDGGIIITGRTNTDDNGNIIGDTQGEDLWIFKLGGSTTGIDEQLNRSFSIYPNPADDMLYFSEPLKNIEIYSVSGQRLMQHSNINQVNISSLVSGTYLLQTYMTDGKRIIYKIIKK